MDGPCGIAGSTRPFHHSDCDYWSAELSTDDVGARRRGGRSHTSVSWVLIALDQYTRRIVGIGVHRGHVDGRTLCRMFNSATAGHPTPLRVSKDYDPLFEAHRWQANMRVLEISSPSGATTTSTGFTEASRATRRPTWPNFRHIALPSHQFPTAILLSLPRPAARRSVIYDFAPNTITRYAHGTSIMSVSMSFGSPGSPPP